jgi:hypothetical protein
MDPALADRVAAELETGERLVWAGQPRLDLATRPKYLLIPFGIAFLVFSLVWMIVAGLLTLGLMAPCALPFIAVGIGMIMSPVWLRRRAQKVLYALTDRRAMIWEPGWFRNITVRTYTAAGLGRMARMERADGSGDLVFEEFTTATWDSNTNTNTHTTTRRGFLCIDQVREIEDLVRRTLLSESH